jgi:hypothetical protein
MEKFLSIPVNGQANQLVSVTNVILVAAGTGATNNTPTATTTTITYSEGKVVTLTHAAQVAYSMRTAIQNALIEARQSSWTNVATVITVPQAVSAVTVA